MPERRGNRECRRDRTVLSLGNEWAAVCHGFTHLVCELSHGFVTRAAGFGIHAGTAGFEHIVVVVVGNYPGEEVKPGGSQDFEQMLKPGISLSVFYGAYRTTRGSSQSGQLVLSESGRLTGLHHQRCSEGGHPLRRSDVELIVVHGVTEVRADRSHVPSVPDPRHDPLSRRGRRCA